MDNLIWSEQILKKTSSGLKHRWVIYSELLEKLINKETVWIDGGCGDNSIVADFGARAKTATGIDLIDHDPQVKNYIKADIRKMPFPSEYADLVTLRFVVEHFENSETYLNEIYRVLKPGGKIVFLTTNLQSPLILLPRIILPNPIKRLILSKLFKVSETDIFPTYHRLNTTRKIKRIGDKFRIEKLQYISDFNYQRKWIFHLLLFYHKLTAPTWLNKYRAILLVILTKK